MLNTNITHWRKMKWIYFFYIYFQWKPGSASFLLYKRQTETFGRKHWKWPTPMPGLPATKSSPIRTISTSLKWRIALPILDECGPVHLLYVYAIMSTPKACCRILCQIVPGHLHVLSGQESSQDRSSYDSHVVGERAVQKRMSEPNSTVVRYKSRAAQSHGRLWSRHEASLLL